MFKRGDLVKIVKKVTDSLWVDAMDDYVGQTFVADSSDSPIGCGSFFYPNRSLKFVRSLKHVSLMIQDVSLLVLRRGIMCQGFLISWEKFREICQLPIGETMQVIGHKALRVQENSWKIGCTNFSQEDIEKIKQAKRKLKDGKA